MSKYPSYEQMKDSGIEWLGEIPEHWEINKLIRKFNIVNGGTPKSSNKNYWNGEIVWITPADLSELDSPHITSSNRTITKQGEANSSATLVPENSLVISKRAPIGYVAISKVELCTNQGCYSLVEKKQESVINKYVYYYIDSIKNYLKELGQGSTFMELSSSDLGEVDFLYPPLKEQKAIADFLNREIGRIDELIEKKEKLIKLLEEKRQATISQAVTKGLDSDVEMKDSGIEWLGEIPEYWGKIPLKYIASNDENSFVDGPFGSNLKSEEYQDDGIPLIQLNNIANGEHIIRNTKFISEEKAEELSRHNIESGDIVIAKMADPVARAAEVSKEYSKYVIVADCIKLDPDTNICNIQYLVYTINSPYVRYQAEAVASGSTRLRINLGKMKNIFVYLPPLEEQKEIADYLDQETNRIDNLIEKTKEQIANLKEYKQALISNAVTGKIKIIDN